MSFELSFSVTVIANIKIHGELETRTFPIHNYTDDLTLKNLFLGVRQLQPHAELSLYIDCFNYGTIKIAKTFRDIYNNMRNPQILFVSLRAYITLFFFQLYENLDIVSRKDTHFCIKYEEHARNLYTGRITHVYRVQTVSYHSRDSIFGNYSPQCGV